MAVGSRQMTIDEEYVATRAGSGRLYREALEVFPSGVTHDSRYFQPFPIYITHAQGSKKWDVDGHEYIDYWSGHGALMLGHNHPELVAAAVAQLQKGTHYGACHDLEVRWGQLVCDMVPCAERVKLLSSGTEASMMALRLARAYTGRTKILKFEGHFHGWHDYVTAGVRPPFDIPTSVGIPKEVLGTVVVVPPNDIRSVQAVLRGQDVAAVILEPAGASTGLIPTRPGFLAELREVTRQTGTLLIFDEVVTGFRMAPGGAQEYYGVIPDLCILAKALVGGLPGGAIAGRKDIMALFEFSDDAQRNRTRRIAHPGTFNANPLAAAVAVANLQILSRGRENVYQHTYRMGDMLRTGMNEVIKRHSLPGCVYGETSVFKIALGQKFADLTVERAMSGTYDHTKLVTGMGPLGGKFRRAMLLEGVDLPGTGGLIMAAHTSEDIERTITAFDRALGRLKAEGVLGQ